MEAIWLLLSSSRQSLLIMPPLLGILRRFEAEKLAGWCAWRKRMSSTSIH
jgi:hypothetical protein